jgi:hypothetical protein
VIALGDRPNALPHLLDHARSLVAEHRRRVAGRIGTGRRVEIRVADAARDEPDQDLAGLRVRQVHLLDHQRLAELLQHRRAHLHPGFLHVVRDPAAAKAMAASRP